MKIKDRIDYLRTINDRIYEQLAYAETKNGIMIGLLTAILGVIAGVLIAGIQLCCWLKIYFWLILSTFTIALIVCIFSFFPVLRTLNNIPKPNLFFYGDLAELNSVEEYEHQIAGCTDIAPHIEAQNIQVSKIIIRKHKCFKISLHFVMAGILLPIYLIYLIVRIVKTKKAKKVQKQGKDSKEAPLN